MYNGPIIKKKL